MIEVLKSLFEIDASENADSPEDALQLAAAALLVEMSRADFSMDEDETRVMRSAMVDALGVDQSELDNIIDLARKQADQATSLYEFTRLINDHYSRKQKLSLIESLWRVAYADGDLDKYEERLIRQVADLIYVSHKDFIRLKLQVSGR